MSRCCQVSCAKTAVAIVVRKVLRERIVIFLSATGGCLSVWMGIVRWGRLLYDWSPAEVLPWLRSRRDVREEKRPGADSGMDSRGSSRRRVTPATSG